MSFVEKSSNTLSIVGALSRLNCCDRRGVAELKAITLDVVFNKTCRAGYYFSTGFLGPGRIALGAN